MYREPYRPCSSPATAAKTIVACGRWVAITRASSSDDRHARGVVVRARRVAGGVHDVGDRASRSGPTRRTCGRVGGPAQRGDDVGDLRRCRDPVRRAAGRTTAVRRSSGPRTRPRPAGSRRRASRGRRRCRGPGRPGRRACAGCRTRPAAGRWPRSAGRRPSAAARAVPGRVLRADRDAGPAIARVRRRRPETADTTPRAAAER